MIDKEKFNFTENDVEKDGHVYCKICGERVDGETLDLPFAKFTPRVMCACDRKRKQADEERERLMKVSMLKNSCFISPIQTQYTFENYLKGNDQAYQVSKNYVDNFAQMKKDNIGLLFHGNVGSGKTYLACAIANALIEKELLQVRMHNLSQIINQLQHSGFNSDRNGLISSLGNIPLLILDDLGIERDTSYAREQVYNIINERYLKGRPTIFTTNLSLKNLQDDHVDLEYQRIYSRILEMAIPIRVAGEDFRKKIHQEKLNKYKDLLTRGGEAFD